MADRNSRLGTLAALNRAEHALTRRLGQLEEQIAKDDAAAWIDYRETVAALAALLPAIASETSGHMLTTQEMAQRLGVTPKTLLKRKARGEIRPAVQAGKLIRWNGAERV